MRCSHKPKLRLREVRRHITEDSCWLVAGPRVYDVTALLSTHPGGARSILRKAGGADCSKDMAFHTRSVRKTLDTCLVGKLQRCGDNDSGDSDASASSGCSIM